MARENEGVCGISQIFGNAVRPDLSYILHGDVMCVCVCVGLCEHGSFIPYIVVLAKR